MVTNCRNKNNAYHKMIPRLLKKSKRTIEERFDKSENNGT